MYRSTNVSRRQMLAGVSLASVLVLGGCTTLAPPAPPAGARAAQPQQPPPGSAQPAQPAPAVGSAQREMSVPPPPGGSTVPAIGNGIAVIGEGQVRAQPDVATISAGVQTRAQTAREAQDENNRLMQQVIERLKALGIPEADIRTSGLGLHPIHEPPRDPAQGGDKQVSAYVASNSVVATVRDVQRAGEVLDAAITAGANQSAGVQFGLQDDTTFRHQALQEAVNRAREKANAIAAAARLQITGIQSLTEDFTGGGPPVPVMMSQAAEARAVPIEPGQLVVTARVRAVFAVQ